MKIVTDRIVQYANRYKLTNVETGEILGTFDFDEVTGTVQQSGTAIDAELFDSIKNDFLSIIQGTQTVGRVGATQLTNQNINTFVGADYWGKVFYIPSGSSVTGLPQNTNGGTLEVLRGGVQTTVHRYTATSDSSGESISPNILQRQYLTSWSDWEEVVSADGNYPTLGAGYLAKNLFLKASSGAGWYKIAEISTTSTAYDVYSLLLVVNTVYQTQTETSRYGASGQIEVDIRLQDGAILESVSGITVSYGNISTRNFSLVVSEKTASLYYKAWGSFSITKFVVLDEHGEHDRWTLTLASSFYGTTAPSGAIYAVVRNNASELNEKAVSDIFESDGVTAKEATNAQKLGNKAASEYALTDDIPDVSNFAEKNGNYPNMTVGNAAKLNGKAASDIFESDGVTAKEATSLIPDSNGAVNPLGRKENGVVGTASTAFGVNAEASGTASTALGDSSNASGLNSTALGYSATASGTASTALGYSATASGTASTALGYSAIVPNTDRRTMQLGSTTLSALRCAVNLTVTSDKRDKIDIASIADALAFVERLNPVTFVSNDRVEYISDEDKKGETFRKYGMCDYDRIAHAAGTKKGERRRCGLLAQEVIEAMQSVYGTDNYANIVNDNFHDLQEKPDVENKYTLAYANLVPFLIGAIKELNAKIKELEGRNNV